MMHGPDRVVSGERSGNRKAARRGPNREGLDPSRNRSFSGRLVVTLFPEGRPSALRVAPAAL